MCVCVCEIAEVNWVRARGICFFLHFLPEESCDFGFCTHLTNLLPGLVKDVRFFVHFL